MTDFATPFQKFAADKRGSTAVIFSVAGLALIGAIGAAVSYS